MDNFAKISVPNDVPEPDRTDHPGPMTPSQASHLKSLSSEAGVPVDLGLNSHDAAKRIAELESKMGRGGTADA